MKQLLSSLGPLCIAGAMLFGCASGDLDTSNGEATSAETADADAQTVALRFVHASATSAAFDVYLGASTTPLWTAVAFGTATPYVAVPPDGIQLVIRAAGAAATDAPVFTTDIIVASAGDSVTAFAGGIVGSTLASNKFRVQALTEAFTRDNRHAVVRFVQESHGLPAAGFDIGADGTTGGTIEAPSIAAFTASDAAGLAIDRSFRAVQLGIDTGTPAKQLTAFTLSPDVLEQRGGVFLALVGLPTFVPSDTRGLALLAVDHHGATLIRQNPTVYVLPVIPDSAGVDVFALGTQLAPRRVGQNLAFGTLTSLQVAPSQLGYGLVVTRPGTDTQPGWPLTIASTGPLTAGERYLAIASGFESGGFTGAHGRSPVRIEILHDGFARAATTTGMIRAVAAAADAPAVDVGQIPPGTTSFVGLPGLENLSYRQSSAEPGVSVTAAPLNPGVLVTGTSNTLQFSAGALLPSDRVFGIVAGAFAPMAGDLQSRFVIVKTPASGAWTTSTLSPTL